MNEIVIGTKVQAAMQVIKVRHSGDKVTWESKPVQIEKAVYLGWVTVFEGLVMDQWDGPYMVREFKPKKAIRVAVLQPIDVGGRYRKPVYALPEDLEEIS